MGGLKASGEDTTRFDAYVQIWYRGIFAPRLDWAGQTLPGHQPIKQAGLDQLWSLAQLLKVLKLDSTLEDNTLQELSASLEEADRLTREVAGIPDRERIYVLGLIAEARAVIADVQTFGTAGLRRLAAEIGGSLMVVAGRTNDASMREKLVGQPHLV